MRESPTNAKIGAVRAISTEDPQRYLLEAVLGRGATGVVYRALDRQRQQRCALKVLKASGDPRATALRFRREFRAAQRIEHPHCVRMYELGRSEAGWYFTMELATHGTLTRAVSTLPVTQVAHLGLQILSALDRVHASRVVHRDVKPENILLFDAPEGAPPGTVWAKLGDFGVAQVADHDTRTSPGQIVGTPRYLAPEQLDGESIDARADLYSLGIVLYEALAGRHPYEDDRRSHGNVLIDRIRRADPLPLRDRIDGVPADLAAFVDTLVARRRDERFRTAAQAFAALQACVESSEDAPDLSHLPSLEGSAYLAAPRLVGRERELDRLRTFFEAAFNGGVRDAVDPPSPAPVALVVAGSAGVGKSRLLSRAVALSRAHEPLVLFGACHPASASAYEALGETLATLSAPDLRGAPSVRDETVAETVTAGPTRRAPAFEVLRETAKTRFVMECTDRLLEVASARPCLLVVEDVQWADLSTLELLVHWIRTLGALRADGRIVRAAIVLTHRSGPGELPSEALVETRKLAADGLSEPIDLAPLPPEDAEALVASMLMEPNRSVVSSFTRRVFGTVRHTPLHIGQVLHLCLGHGWLTGATRPWDGRWRLDTVAEEEVLRLPQRIVEAIGERALHLSVRTQELLAAASVLGRRFDVEVLRRMVRMAPIDILDALEEAEHAGFVEERGAAEELRYSFAHDRFVDAIYGQLPPGRRAAWHRAAAGCLAERAEEPGTAARLAWHFREAGKHEEAFRHGVRAADEALAAFAFRRAADLYDAATESAMGAECEIPDRVRRRHADACTGAGRYDEADRLYEALAANAETEEERLDVLRRAAELGYRRAKLSGATAPLVRVLEQLGLDHPHTSVAVVRSIVADGSRLVASTLREPSVERDAATPAVAEGLARRRSRIVAQTCVFLGEVYFYTNFRYTLHYTLRAANAAVAARSAEDVAMTFSLVSYVFTIAGLRRLARRLAAIAERHAESTLPPADHAHVLTMTGNGHLARGELDAAIERFARAYRLCENEGDPLRLANAGGSWSVALWHARRTAEAASVAARLIELGRRHQLDRLLQFGRFAETLGALGRGEHAAVASASAALAEDFGRTGDHMGRLVSEARRALALAFLGRSEEALSTSLGIADEWLRRGLVSPSDPVVGYAVATAALHVAGGGRLRASDRRRVDRARRVGTVVTSANLPEHVFLVAASGSFDVAIGRHRQGLARFEQGLALAHRYGFELPARLAERLAERVLTRSSIEGGFESE